MERKRLIGPHIICSEYKSNLCKFITHLIQIHQKPKGGFCCCPQMQFYSFKPHISKLQSLFFLCDGTEDGEEVKCIVSLPLSFDWICQHAKHAVKVPVAILKRGCDWLAVTPCKRTIETEAMDVKCPVMYDSDLLSVWTEIGHFKVSSAQRKHPYQACLSWLVHNLECLLVKSPKHSH